ncbi:MAG: HI0074 family nucleotidyltransferase substrate-binding subunit [Clostridiales bacterium]|nr:HI0074 family nucleotidyltransferase substrate-binding subunit [Clostridiales bacterium]
MIIYFCSTLKNLKDIYKYEEPYNIVILTGSIRLFDICFDMSFKMIEEILEKAGYGKNSVNYPKTILKTAYETGMTEDEELLLSALNSRNNTEWFCSETAALGIIRLTKEKYYNMFSELKTEIDTNWKTI